MAGFRKAVLAAAVSLEKQKHDPDVFLLHCRGYAEGQGAGLPELSLTRLDLTCIFCSVTG